LRPGAFILRLLRMRLMRQRGRGLFEKIARVEGVRS
jgi:hypothetical protein